MMSPEERRGGAPVGYLHEFDAPDAQAICLLRHWCTDGEAGLHQYLSGGSTKFKTAVLTDAMSQIGSVLAQHGRRPFMRHDAQCQCVGGDEACFATMINAAAEGAREDAMMLACLMVRADFSPVLVGLAEQLGLALRSGTPMAEVQIRPADAVLH